MIQIKVKKYSTIVQHVGFPLYAIEIHSFKSNVSIEKNRNKVSTPEPTPDSTLFDTPKPIKSQTNK